MLIPFKIIIIFLQTVLMEELDMLLEEAVQEEEVLICFIEKL